MNASKDDSTRLACILNFISCALLHYIIDVAQEPRQTTDVTPRKERNFHTVVEDTEMHTFNATLLQLRSNLH